MERFSNRLKDAMELRNITQTELCRLTNIPKSAMSQYISGNFKPKQARTYSLSDALGVNPAWLMGYDVPIDLPVSPTNNSLFWENLIRLCNENGISPNGVCSALGFSNATATKWKSGAVPRYSTVKKIADYFGITPDELLGKESSTNKSNIPLENLMENQTDIELTTEIARLIKTDDEWTKRFIIKLLRMPPQNREIFKAMLTSITSE